MLSLVTFSPTLLPPAPPNACQVYFLLCTESKYLFLGYVEFSFRSIDYSGKAQESPFSIRQRNTPKVSHSFSGKRGGELGRDALIFRNPIFSSCDSHLPSCNESSNQNLTSSTVVHHCIGSCFLLNCPLIFALFPDCCLPLIISVRGNIFLLCKALKFIFPFGNFLCISSYLHLFFFFLFFIIEGPEIILSLDNLMSFRKLIPNSDISQPP